MEMICVKETGCDYDTSRLQQHGTDRGRVYDALSALRFVSIIMK
jgi:hypothetical protein